MNSHVLADFKAELAKPPSDRRVEPMLPWLKLLQKTPFISHYLDNDSFQARMKLIVSRLQYEEYPSQTIFLHEGLTSQKYIFIISGRVAIYEMLGSQNMPQQIKDTVKDWQDIAKSLPSRSKMSSVDKAMAILTHRQLMGKITAEKAIVCNAVLNLLKKDSVLANKMLEEGTILFTPLTFMRQNTFLGQLGMINQRGKSTASALSMQPLQTAYLSRQSFEQLFSQQILEVNKCQNYLCGIFGLQLVYHLCYLGIISLRKRYGPLTRLWCQGDKASHFLIIERGEVKIDHDRRPVLLLSNNSFCGQESIITKKLTRAYSAITLTEVIAYQIDFNQFLRFRWRQVTECVRISTEFKLNRMAKAHPEAGLPQKPQFKLQLRRKVISSRQLKLVKCTDRIVNIFQPNNPKKMLLKRSVSQHITHQRERARLLSTVRP